jgi:hypothetical protein
MYVCSEFLTATLEGDDVIPVICFCLGGYSSRDEKRFVLPPADYPSVNATYVAIIADFMGSFPADNR